MSWVGSCENQKISARSNGLFNGPAVALRRGRRASKISVVAAGAGGQWQSLPGVVRGVAGQAAALMVAYSVARLIP